MATYRFRTCPCCKKATSMNDSESRCGICTAAGCLNTPVFPGATHGCRRPASIEAPAPDDCREFRMVDPSEIRQEIPVSDVLAYIARPVFASTLPYHLQVRS